MLKWVMRRRRVFSILYSVYSWRILAALEAGNLRILKSQEKGEKYREKAAGIVWIDERGRISLTFASGAGSLVD